MPSSTTSTRPTADPFRALGAIRALPTTPPYGMSSLRTLALLLLAAFAFPACDSAEELVIGGTYSGLSNTQAGLETTLTVVIPETESGETFTFSATTVQGSQTVAFSGTGTYDHPAISITARDDGPTADDTIAGTVSGDGLTITFVPDDDSGLGPITLRRR